MSLEGEFVEVRNRAVLESLLRRAHDADRGLLFRCGPGDPAARPRESEMLRLSLAGLREVVHHDPGDQSITVAPGARVEEIQARLARDGQMLAVEAPRGELTVGDLVLEGRESFCALRHGPLREQILGVTALLPDGRVCRSGGRVAKNVTGYDLNRLHCGGGGRFGVPLEISLRLRPRPRARRTWILARPDAEAAMAVAAGWRALPHRTSALAIAGGDAVVTGRGPWLVALRVDGSPAALADVGARLAAEGAPESLEGADERAFWDGLGALPHRRPSAVRLRHPLRGLALALEGELEVLAAAGGGGLVADLALPGFWRLPARAAAGAAPPRRSASSARALLEERLRAVFDPRGILQRGRDHQEYRS